MELTKFVNLKYIKNITKMTGFIKKIHEGYKSSVAMKGGRRKKKQSGKNTQKKTQIKGKNKKDNTVKYNKNKTYKKAMYNRKTRKVSRVPFSLRGGGLSDIQPIYHCTNVKTLPDILKSGKLLTQLSREKLGIKRYGEGGPNRKIGDHKAVLENPDYWKDLDEANGVYFRVKKPHCDKNMVSLVFSVDILNSSDFHINTTENNGFYLGLPGESVLGPYSGSVGVTYDKTNIESYVPRYDKHHELVITSDVDLNNNLLYISAFKNDIETVKQILRENNMENIEVREME